MLSFLQWMNKNIISNSSQRFVGRKKLWSLASVSCFSTYECSLVSVKVYLRTLSECRGRTRDGDSHIIATPKGPRTLGNMLGRPLCISVQMLEEDFITVFREHGCKVPLSRNLSFYISAVELTCFKLFICSLNRQISLLRRLESQTKSCTEV